MEELRKQLASLDADQVKQLLSASGHNDLLVPLQLSRQDQRDDQSMAVDVAALKVEANELFKQGKFDDAVRAYTRCIDASDGTDPTLLSNRAMANLKLQRYAHVVDDCSTALSINASIKPYLRRATAFLALGDTARSVSDLDAALALEPSNRDALRILEQMLVAKPSHDRRSRLKAALLVAFRDGWKSMPVTGNPAPPGLNGHMLFSLPFDDRKSVFLYGGRAVRDQKAEVYVMDNEDYSWDRVTSTGTPPTARAWHSVCALDDDTLCVYGGASGCGEDPQIHLLHARMSPHGYKLAWQDHPAITHVPSSFQARSGHTAICVALQETIQCAIIFGGRAKTGVTNELWSVASKSALEVSRIDPTSDSRLLPPPRDGHSMVLWTHQGGHHAIVFGGNGQKTDDKMNDLWMLDVVSWRWTELVCSGDIPPPRSYHSAHIVDDFMFVIGGRMVDAEDGDVFLLDIAEREWHRISVPRQHALTPRAWHASILRDEKNEIYVLGGGTFHGPSREAAVLSLANFKIIAAQLSEATP